MRKPYQNNKPDRTKMEREGQESWLSAAICIFSVMDFSKMETVDWIFTVTFAIWFVLTIVRCCIYYRKSR